jgi:tRNA-splicing ligase RtcB
MRVDGIVFASDELIAGLRHDPCLEQVANVATLPGIVGASLAMPDVHWGYGFPVGGVAATSLDEGVISPGGIGFDINCGVRLLALDLQADAVSGALPRLADALFAAVPSGVGAHGGIRLGRGELDRVMREGARWVTERDPADLDSSGDLEVIEERGSLGGADPGAVSPRAHQRGADQLGTLGSGNHFLEVGRVDLVEDAAAAAALGLHPGQLTVLVHCGSRGLGHQVCTDHVATMDRLAIRRGMQLVDRQLACAPLGSPEADTYLAAMAAAANYAWANRQAITTAIRQTLARVLGPSARARLVYDLSHNIAKIERHTVDGDERTVCVHRKGATRAFPPGHPDVPDRYRAIGQPVLVPGDMGRYSYVAVGAPGAMALAFGSTCHGAGRNLSRHAAVRQLRGVNVAAELERDGILVRAERRDLLAEEASPAYRDVADVMAVAAGAGLVRSVARLRPLAVIKG